MRKLTKQELMDKGLCPICGKENDRLGKCMCSKCRERNSKNRKEIYEYRKRIHVCVRCGKHKAEPHKTMCINCIESEKIRNAKAYDRDKATEAKRKQTAKRIANGKCPECGKHPLYMGGECQWCRAKQKRYRDSKRQDIERYERPSYGLCYICGNPLDNSDKKVCKKCYEVRLSTVPYMLASPNNEYWRKLETARIQQVISSHAV